MSSRAAAAGALYALTRVSADLGDHWIQTHNQALTKAQDSAAGRRACAAHVATYVAAQAVTVGAGALLLGIRITPGRAIAALAVSGITHYAADRRAPVRRLAETIGKKGFYDLGGPLGGSYLLDQSLHHAAEAVAVAILATGTPRAFVV
ncbi:transcriptional regulator [Streptomyces sp. SID3212]|nr:transcriptional regulator [Streptomyces sp. SID3212]